MIQFDNKYLNYIKYSGNSINRIYFGGGIYWGKDDITPTPPTPPIPSHLTPVTCVYADTRGIYINSGVSTSLDISIETQYRLYRYSNYSRIFDTVGTNLAWDIAGVMAADYESNVLRFKYVDITRPWITTSLSSNDSNIHVIKLSSTNFELDGNVINTHNNTGLTLNNGTITISSIHDTGYYEYYYVKIWDGNTLVRDYIPVFDTTNNVAGLYDRVNNVFKGSDGNNNWKYIS